MNFLRPAAGYLLLGRKVPDSVMVQQRWVGYCSVGAERYLKKNRINQYLFWVAEWERTARQSGLEHCCKFSIELKEGLV